MMPRGWRFWLNMCPLRVNRERRLWASWTVAALVAAGCAADGGVGDAGRRPPSCSSSAPTGSCPANQTCVAGSCCATGQACGSMCCATGEACVDGSCAASSDPCAASSDCASCSSTNGCGWCNGLGNCHTGTTAGPTDGACAITDWTIVASRCPSSDPCAGIADCATCTGASACGWCGTLGSCHAGVSGGASDGACSGSDWSWTSNQCRAPDGGIQDAARPTGCGAVPFNGTCSSSTHVQVCTSSTDDGSPAVYQYDCPGGATCSRDASGIAGCHSVAPCLEGQTQCVDSTTLRTCTGGAWATTPCPRQCIGSPLGDFCGVNLSTTTLTGSLTYEFHVPNAAGTDWDPTIQTAPGQGFLLLSYHGTQLVDARVTSLGTTTGGQFSIMVPSVPDSTDRVVVALAATDGTAVTYFVASPGFTAAGVHDVREVPLRPTLFSWSWNTNTLTSGARLSIPEAQNSGAARRFDYMRYAYASTAAHFGGRSGLPFVAWMEGEVRWSCGSCNLPAPTTVFGIPVGTQIFYSGDAAASEYWADSVTAHELGHWAMTSYGHPPGEGGPHYIGGHTYPGMAWSEGWATWFGSDARQSSFYFDKQTSASGSTVVFWFDIAARQYSGPTWRRPTPGAGLDQEIDENEVAAMLWGASGNGTADGPLFDALASSHLRGPFFRRGYQQHVNVMVDMSSGDQFNGMPDGIPAPYLADFLDALDCAGFDRGTLDATTQPTGYYPYVSGSPLCP